MSSSSPPLLGADTMLFIYHFEANPAFGSVVGRILSAVENGRCRLIVSSLVLMEVLVAPKRHGERRLCQRYRDFFQSFPNLQMLPMGAEVAEIASDLRAAHNLRTPDALHMATGHHAGADAFLTEDRRLRSTPEIAVWRFDEALDRLSGSAGG